MIGDHPDDPGRRNERGSEQERDLFSHLPGADEQPKTEHDREREEGVDVEERHRRVERPLDPPRDEPAPRAGRFVGVAREIFPPPMHQKQQPRWNRVKQAALGDEHRQRDAFPGDLFRLVIDKVKLLKKRVAGEAAVEKKSGNPEGAAPAIKAIEGRERTEQSGPDEGADQVKCWRSRSESNKSIPAG